MCAVVLEFNLGLLQIEACEETSIVPKGSDIEILPSANNNSSSFKDKHQCEGKSKILIFPPYHRHSNENCFFLLKLG